MDQIEKIKYMEQNLNEAAIALATLERALEGYESIQGQLQELSAYYGSPEWFRDYDDDCAGKLPADLKRGVLSEDAVYNLLADNRSLLCRMEKMVAEENKKRNIRGKDHETGE